MSYKAVLFGSIGTLAETSDLQRDAFNEAFKISGLAVSYTHLTLPTTYHV